MKLIDEGKIVYETPVPSGVAGIRISDIVLNDVDFYHLAQLKPEQLKEWVNRMLCRFHSHSTLEIEKKESDERFNINTTEVTLNHNDEVHISEKGNVTVK